MEVIVIKKLVWIIIAILVAVFGMILVLNQYENNVLTNEQVSQVENDDSLGQNDNVLSSENNENDSNSKQESLIDSGVSSSQISNSSSQNPSENNNSDATDSDESEWTELYPATPID